MFASASWLNPPAHFEVDAKQLSVTTAKETDFWRETFDGFIRDSGHLFGVSVNQEFTAQVRVAGRFDVEYDQAGIMVYVDDHTWIKTGAEFSGGTLSFSSVLTVGQSDWAVGAPVEDYSFLIRVTVSAGVVQVHGSQNGAVWFLLRMAPFPSTGPFLVGPMCCSPSRAGLMVEFDSFEIAEPSADAAHATHAHG
jgi:uncharacterized protein